MVESIKKVKQRHRGKWFERTTYMIRRLPAYAFTGRDGASYFVTSDAITKSDRVRYTIRILRPDGTVGCYGGYRAYGSRARAEFVARTLSGTR